MERRRLVQLQDQINRVLSRELFFVAGAPKSGTTWLQRLLDAHPEVACAGEGHFADKLATLLTPAFDAYNQHQRLVGTRVYENTPDYSGLKREHFEFTVASLACLMMAQRPIGDEIRCIGDKTPRYTFYLPFLSELFPSARFVHIIRDGRDVVVSLSHHALRAGQAEAVRPGSEQFLDNTQQFSKAWAENIHAARRFADAHPNRYCEIRYEGLLDQPAATLTAVFDFLGVDSSPSTIRACQEAADFRRLSGGRSRGDEDKSSFFRKGVAGDWRNYLDDESLAAFNPAARELLSTLGYE